MKPAIAIVGCGKVGTALGVFLHAAGYPLAGLSSLDLSAAQDLSALTAKCPCDQSPWVVTREAEVIFLTTPDGTIADVCRTIAENRGFTEQSIALHCSGALPSTILSQAKNCGAAIGSFHPLQSFASRNFAANPFEGIIATTEGDPTAVLAAQQMASDLGATCYTLKTEGKILYHAAAVAASNYLVTLMGFALRMMTQAGIGGQQAFDVLKPLVEGTLANIESLGTTGALTGPISRGDSDTVAAHLKAIEEKMPADLDLFKTLARHTFKIAKAQGGLSESDQKGLKELFEC